MRLGEGMESVLREDGEVFGGEGGAEFWGVEALEDGGSEGEGARRHRYPSRSHIFFAP